MDDEQAAVHYGPGRMITGAEWDEWNRKAGEWRERALTAEGERDRLRAQLHELMARDVDVVDLMNVQYGCPDCGVHHACGEIVVERDRLRTVVHGALLAIETVLTDDHVDMGVPAGVVLGRTSAALKQALGDRLEVAGGATDG